MLRELAPLLAEEGIDVDNIDVPDLETLQAALDRAVERQNLARFTPVGHSRELVITTLRRRRGDRRRRHHPAAAILRTGPARIAG